MAKKLLIHASKFKSNHSFLDEPGLPQHIHLSAHIISRTIQFTRENHTRTMHS